MSTSALMLALMLQASPALYSQEKPQSPPMASNQVDSVQTQGQTGGVTAGNIGTVNQVLPTLVRGPLLEQFKAAFAEGASLRMALFEGGKSDAEYQKLLSACGSWANQMYGWLLQSFGPYAAQRFNFRTSMSLSYSGGLKDAALSIEWNNTINAMTGWLQNVDLLMREPSIYPVR